MADNNSKTTHADEEQPVSDNDSQRGQRTEQPKKKHKPFVILSFVIYVIIIIAVSTTVAIRLPLRKGERHHQIMVHHLSVIVQSRLPTLSFNDTSTPEYKALQWMTGAHQHPGRLSDDRLLQRFAMAAIMFHIGGFDDLMSKHDVCLWGLPGVDCDGKEWVNKVRFAVAGEKKTIPITLGLLSHLTVGKLAIQGNPETKDTQPSRRKPKGKFGDDVVGRKTVTSLPTNQ